MAPTIIYILIALSLAVPTIVEGNQKKMGWGLSRLTGIAACLTWPLLIIALLVSAPQQRSAV